MKKLIFLMIVALISTFGDVIARPTVTVGVNFIIGRPKFFCEKGIWICKPKLDIDIDLEGRQINANFTDNGNGTMTINFLSDLPETGAEFYADRDEEVSLPTEICRKFGYQSIVIIPGTYRIAKSTSSQFGSVTVKIQTR